MVNQTPAPTPAATPASVENSDTAEPVNEVAETAQRLAGKEEQFTQGQKGDASVALSSAEQSWLSPFAGLESLSNMLSPTPQPSSMHDFINHLKSQQDMIPGDGADRWVADQVGNIAGFALNPISLLGGEAGSVAVEKGAQSLLGVLPEATSAIGAVAAKTVPSLARGTGGIVGATELGVVNDAYNEDTNSIDVPQFMKETGINAGLGFAFGAGEAAFSQIGAKLKQNKIDATQVDAAKQAADKGIITPEQAQFYEESQKTGNRNNPKFESVVNDTLKNNGSPMPDATGNINLSVLSAQDMENIHSVLPYEIASTAPGEDINPKISEYIAQNALDKATSNNAMIDTLKNLVDDHEQHVDALEQKVKDHLENAQAIDNLYKDDATIKEHLDNTEISQQKIYEKEVSGEGHDFYAPKKVVKKADLAREINALKEKTAIHEPGSLPERAQFGGSSYRTKSVDRASLYHETDLKSAETLLREDLGGLRPENLFLSDNPDIAIGQGGKGVKIEYEGKRVSAEEHRKPGTSDLTGREYIADTIAKNAIKSIEVDKNAKLTPRMERLLEKYFTMKKGNGEKTIFVRKSISDSSKRAAANLKKLQSQHDAIQLEPLSDELHRLYKDMKTDGALKSEDDFRRIEDLTKNNVPLAKTIKNVVDAKTQLNINKDRVTIAKALIEYSKFKSAESPKEKLVDLVNHARGVIESKITDYSNKQYQAAVEKIDAETALMDDSDMKAFGDKAAETDEEFGNDIKEAVTMYEKVKGSAKLLSDYIKCMGGLA